MMSHIQKIPNSIKTFLPSFHHNGRTSSARGTLGKIILATGIATVTGTSLFVYSEDAVPVTKWPWPHNGIFSTYDHASIRRGYQVYKEVCSACHSLKRISYRHLVGVSHTMEQAKAEASNITVMDGPNDEGQMFERPGKINDYMPSPYPNDEASRFANGGALPPDLSLITKARNDGQNYVFSLLMGYSDPPAGVGVKGNLHYNKYFPGASIAMAQNLYDGIVDYEDGTPASASQMAKDVTTFLSWAAEPEHDERKRMGMKAMVLCGALVCFVAYMKRHRWSYLKNRILLYKPSSTGTKTH